MPGRPPDWEFSVPGADGVGQGLAPLVYQTNTPQSLRANTYNGFETSVQGRLPQGAFAFAGWTMDRELSRICDQTVNPTTFLNDPNSLRFCDWHGNLYQDLGRVGSIPYRHEFKLQGNVPLWYKFEVSASLYSDPVYNTNFQLNNYPHRTWQSRRGALICRPATRVQRSISDHQFDDQVLGEL